MKIPNRLELSEQLNAQRKLEIDNGIYLATRVDKLRETLVQLEQQQKIFVDTNRKVIEDAIADLVEKKSDVESELKELEERRKELLKPLDKEWASVQDEKEQLLKERKELDLLVKFSEDTQQEYETRNKESAEEFERANVANQTAQEELSLIHARLKEVNEHFAEITDLKEKTEKECSDKLLILARKEQLLDYDRKHYQDFEKETRKKEKELALREKQLVIKQLTQK